jgi:hypothetical protein
MKTFLVTFLTLSLYTQAFAGEITMRKAAGNNCVSDEECTALAVSALKGSGCEDVTGGRISADDMRARQGADFLLSSKNCAETQEQEMKTNSPFLDLTVQLVCDPKAHLVEFESPIFAIGVDGFSKLCISNK